MPFVVCRLPHSEQLMEELLDNLIILPDALTPALLAMNAQKVCINKTPMILQLFLRCLTVEL